MLSFNQRSCGMRCHVMAAPAVGGYNEDFLDLPERLTCFVCLLALKEPQQMTCCGHRACNGCLAHLKNEDGSLTCPMCRKTLTSIQIFPDNAVKREVMDLKVRCPHKKPMSHLQQLLFAGRLNAVGRECLWTGELRERARHDGECEFKVLPCTLGCRESLERHKMANHIRNKCNRRKVSCQYCKVKMENRRLRAHHERCPEYPMPCPQKCSGILLRKQIDHHVSLHGDCDNTMLNCPLEDVGCAFREKRKIVYEHVEKEIVSHLILTHRQNTLRKIHVEEQIASSAESLQQQITDLKEELRSISFTYCWEVTDWSKKSQEATRIGTDAFYSDPFYIGQPGPRMHIMLTCAPNSGIGVFLVPVGGEYDDAVKWPFRHTFSFAVMDQKKNGKDKKVTLTKEYIRKKYPAIFSRPSPLESGKGLGSEKLVSQDEIGRFVKDDCLLVKLEVHRW